MGLLALVILSMGMTSVAVDKFGDALAKTGATKGAENVKINLAPDEEDIQKLDAFAKQLVEKAAKLND